MGGIYNRIERNRGYLLALLSAPSTVFIRDIFGPDAIGQYWAVGGLSTTGNIYVLNSRGDALLNAIIPNSLLSCGVIDKYGFPWICRVNTSANDHRVYKYGLDGSSLTYITLVDLSLSGYYKPFGIASYEDRIYVVGIHSTTSVVRMFEIDTTPGNESILAEGTTIASAGSVEESMNVVKTGRGSFWCVDSNRTGSLINFTWTDLQSSSKSLTWGVGSATAGLMGAHEAFGYIWLGGDTTNSVGSTPPQIAKVDPTDGTVVEVLQFTDALRISDFDDDGTYLYAAVSGKVGATDIGDNRIAKMLPDNENLLTRSEEFDHTDWTPGGCTITADAAASPPGFSGTLADDLVEDVSTARHEVTRTGITAGARITQSIYVKANGRTILTMRGNSPWGAAWFDLSGSGELAALSDNWREARSETETTVESLGSGWFRCSISRNTTPGTSVVSVMFGAAEDTTNTSYTGIGSSALLIFGAQLTTHPKLTSYVQTVASTVTDKLTVEDSFNFDGGDGEELRAVKVVSDPLPSEYPRASLLDASVWFRGDDPDRAKMAAALRHVRNRGPQGGSPAALPVLASSAGSPVSGKINALDAISLDGSSDMRLSLSPVFSNFSTEFDGVNEYVNFGDVFNFERTDSFSVSCWFRTTAGGFLLGRQENAVPTGWLLQVGAATGTPSLGVVRFELNNTWTTNNLVMETTTTWADGSWHHLCVTYDGSSSPSGVLIYIDGSSQTLSTVYSNLTATILNGADFYIGDRELDQGAKPFNGLVDEVSIYNATLSPSEVDDIFNGGSPPDLGSLSSASDLLGWWRMGDGDSFPTISGQFAGGAAFPTIVDESVNSNDGTMINMTAADNVQWVPWSSFSQYCYEFDGVNEYITMGNVVHFEYTFDFSISFWINTTNTSGYIVSKMESSGNFTGWGALLDSGGKVNVYLRNDNSPVNQIRVNGSTVGLNDGRWHHILFTWKGNVSPSASDLHIYVDGQPETEAIIDDSLTATIINTGALTFAARNAGADSPWAGYLTEVAFYDKELTPAEVTWIYNSGEPRDLRDPLAPSALAAWWRIGEAGEQAQSSWTHKVAQWVLGFGTKESTTITDAGPFNSPGTLYSMVAADVTTDTPGGISDYSCTFGPVGYSPLTLCLDLNNDTQDEYVTFGNVSQCTFEKNQAFSIGIWVKFTGTAAGYIFTKDTVTVTGGWILRSTSGTSVDFFLADPLVSFGLQVTSSVNDGAWHQIIVTYDGSNSPSGITTYVDGSSVAGTTSGSPLAGSSASNANMLVGAWDGFSASEFIGKVCHSFVYNKQLSGAEVTTLYNSGTPADLSSVGPTGNLQHWCTLGNGCAIGAGNCPDLSPNNNDGTTVNVESGDFVYDKPVGTVRRSMWSNVASTVYGPYNFSNPTFFTLSGWVKTIDVSGWLWGNANVYAAPNWSGYGVLLDGTGKPKIIWGIGPSGVRDEIVSSVAVNDGLWHHVVVSIWHDFGFRGAWFWIDGVLDGSTTTVSSGGTNNGQGFCIGAAGSSAIQQYPFSGQIDEVSVWSKKFTQDDVDEVFNSGVPTDLRDHTWANFLRGWWRMGDPYYAPGATANMEYTDKIPTSPGASSYSTRSLRMSTSDYVSIAHAPEIDFDFDETFSISAWIFPLGLNGYRAIWYKKSGVGISVTQYGGSGGATYDARNNIRIIFDGATGYWEVYPGGWSMMEVPYGEWFHFVMTHDGSNDANAIKIYINGELWPTWVRYNTAFPGGDTMKNAGDVWLGREATYWVGNQDEVSAWDKELSPAEVTELYNSGNPDDLSTHSAVANLVGWWRMGEAQSDGTMVNMEPEDFVLDAPLPSSSLATLHDGSAYTLVVAFLPTGTGTQTIFTTIEGTIANTETGMALIYDGTAETLRLVIANGSGVDYVIDKTTATGTVPVSGVAVVSVRVDFSDTPEAEIKMWTNAFFAESVEETGTATAQTPTTADAGAFFVGGKGAGRLTGSVGEGVVIERSVTDFELVDLVKYIMRWMPQ
jgi:hypothetical protein